MPKVSSGRLAGLYGMESFTFGELSALADAFEAQLSDPSNTDDPKWLRRWISKIRRLAQQKEHAAEHKSRQRQKRTSQPDKKLGSK
jgi:hypothetical protein